MVHRSLVKDVCIVGDDTELEEAAFFFFLKSTHRGKSVCEAQKKPREFLKLGDSP